MAGNELIVVVFDNPLECFVCFYVDRAEGFARDGQIEISIAERKGLIALEALPVGAGVHLVSLFLQIFHIWHVKHEMQPYIRNKQNLFTHARLRDFNIDHK
jgi:hypothetical protein